MRQQPDYMTYLPDMEEIDSDLMDGVLNAVNSCNFDRYTQADVRRALDAENCTPDDFAALLSPAALPFLEEMAQKAQGATRRHFGNSIYLFTPLYIANYCENQCVYCGFNCHNNIHRARLSEVEIEQEMRVIANTGLEEILILTGESPQMSDVRYIGRACEIARKYFRMVGLEVYPMDTKDYAYLHDRGADFVTVFQETYDPSRYAALHPGGRKRIFPYRFHAQERAVRSGIRGVGFAALLGLADFRKDAFATGMHAYLLQRKYPHVEISFSCPRLRPISANRGLNAKEVGRRQLLQVITAYRLFMPFAGITISSRENEQFRDNAVRIATTKISAGVDVGIGGHCSGEKKGDEQFEIDDSRTVDEICEMLVRQGLQPVMSEYIYV